MSRKLARAGSPALFTLCLAGLWLMPVLGDEPQASRRLDVPYEPTHPEVVDVMLRTAGVNANDRLLDLGCGDGRIVIRAARQYGARGTGIDLDPQRIRESRDNALHAGVSELVEFRRGDILRAELHEATVVTLYLLRRVNLALRPKLFRELRPGARLVSHAFDMGDWEADRIVRHEKARNSVIYFWVMPASVGGVWRWPAPASRPSGLGSAEPATLPPGDAWNGSSGECVLRLTQQFQGLGGTLSCPGAKPVVLTEAAITGTLLTFSARVTQSGAERTMRWRGNVEGDAISGAWQDEGAPPGPASPWMATRDPLDLTGCWSITVSSREVSGGVLCIRGAPPALFATFAAGAGKTSQSKPVEAFYAWGSSVRFELPGGEEPIVFTGVLEGNRGDGVIIREGSTSQSRWTAQRLVRGPDTAEGCQPHRPDCMPEESVAAVALARIPAPGQQYHNSVDGSVLVWIPGGRFLMGNDAGAADERPRHEVTVGGFWLGRFEVTNRQYARFLEANPNTRKPMYWDDPRLNQPEQPVVGVTWKEAKAYCDWAGLRLPTEAEWEYAAAGGAQLTYPSATGEIGPYWANTRGTGSFDRWEDTAPVGSFPSNPFGLFDMAGNAWEWTSTAFAPYPYSATDGREDEDLGLLRVLRGGSWHFPSEYCRTTARHQFASHLRYDYAGIRVARSGAPGPPPVAVARAQ